MLTRSTYPRKRGGSEQSQRFLYTNSLLSSTVSEWKGANWSSHSIVDLATSIWKAATTNSVDQPEPIPPVSSKGHHAELSIMMARRPWLSINLLCITLNSNGYEIDLEI